MLKDYVRLLRVHQYVKNLFIFSPLFFGLKFTEAHLLLRTLAAFAAFSLAASSIYIFNDLRDIEDDRNHPRKKNRPLASGAVSKTGALGLMAGFLLSGVSVAALLGSGVLYLVALYLALNVAYTVRLKHVAIIDVFLIGTGFVIRLFVGSSVTGIDLSSWIVMMTFLLALFMALAKRRDDILIYLGTGIKTRKVVDGYNLEMLSASMIIMASVTIVSYIMYTLSPDVTAKLRTDKLYITVIFVLLGIMRYLQLALVEKKGGSPTEILLTDRFIQLSIAGWLGTFGLLLYR